MLRSVFTALLLSSGANAIMVTPNMKTFGHAIKNGHFLPHGTEITTFEHACGEPPCAITQLHCPTAGPTGWQDAIVRIYVDGETTPSVNISLLEMANVGNFAAGNGMGPGDTATPSPWGVGLFGHTAKNGGVYSTMRIPFGKSVKTTIENATPKAGTFWFIVRGIEAYPVVIGDLQLPAAAKLKLHRVSKSTTPNELVALATVPKGTAGAVLNVKFDAAGHGAGQSNDGYLEACMRAQFDGSDDVTFLSSGAEDYFLSAYYFNEGEFKTPNSGLTYKGAGNTPSAGEISAYKTHDRDPLLFNDGLVLTFRNGEVTTGCGDMGHCPNQFCSNGTAQAFSRPPEPQAGAKARAPSDADYETLVWIYQWPKGSQELEAAQALGGQQPLTARLAELKALLVKGLVTRAEHDAARKAALGI